MTLRRLSVLAAAGAWLGSQALAAPVTHTVKIDRMKFTPPMLEVRVGDTVEWKNEDIVPHTVTAKDKSFDSGKIPEDATWKLTLATKGSFPYGCAYHPSMGATLVVK